MKIRDILATGRPSVSFEIFPPRKDAPFAPVKDAIARLALQKPSFMSVTYGASGNAQANTVAIAALVQEQGVPALAHLTCVAATREGITHETDALRAAGIENVLCLRGDLPKDAIEPPPGCFAHAVDLVRELKPCGFCLGGACYPECHPDCDHMERDIAFLVTQDNLIVQDILIPKSKLMGGKSDDKALVRITQWPDAQHRNMVGEVIVCRLSGTYLPSRFKAIVDRFGEKPEAMLDAGVAYATEQIIDLFANGINAVHVYTMNRPEVAERIMANLRGIL